MVKKKTAKKAIVPKRNQPSGISYTDNERKRIAAEILDALQDGESLTSLCSKPEMPTIKTFLNWCAKYPELDIAYNEAKKVRARSLIEQAHHNTTLMVDKETAYLNEVKNRSLFKLAALMQPDEWSDKTHSQLHKAGRDGDIVNIQINIGG